MFTIGTGVGGGIVLGGSLYRGATGARRRSATQMIGARPLRGRRVAGLGTSRSPARSSRSRPARRSTGSRSTPRGATRTRSSAGGCAADGEVTGHDCVDGAKEGDAAATRCLRILGERLGIGIANAINLFDPLEVVIGGGVSTAGDLLLEPANARRLPARAAGRGHQDEDPARAPRPPRRACSARR